MDKKLRVKKLKHRICDMRGCKNKDTYSLTLSAEFGNSVILCDECMRQIGDFVKTLEAEVEEKAVETKTTKVAEKPPEKKKPPNKTKAAE